MRARTDATDKFGMGALGWAWVGLGGLGWAWVGLGGLGWAWVCLGGLGWEVWRARGRRRGGAGRLCWRPDVPRLPSPEGRWLSPLLAGLPMGWAWSLHFCQRLLEQSVLDAGYLLTDLVRDRRRSPEELRLADSAHVEVYLDDEIPTDGWYDRAPAMDISSIWTGGLDITTPQAAVLGRFFRCCC